MIWIIIVICNGVHTNLTVKVSTSTIFITVGELDAVELY